MVRSSGAIEFDLSPTRGYPLARNARLGRWLTLGVFFTIFGSTLYLAASLTLKSAWSLTDLIAIAFSVWINGVSLYIAIGFTPQAEVLELDEAGFALRYPNGRTRIIRWDDKSLTVRLERTEPSAWPGRSVPSMWVMLGSRPFQNYLTERAFDELIQRAKARGLNTSERPARRRGWTRFNITAGVTKGWGRT